MRVVGEVLIPSLVVGEVLILFDSFDRTLSTGDESAKSPPESANTLNLRRGALGSDGEREVSV